MVLTKYANDSANGPCVDLTNSLVAGTPVILKARDRAGFPWTQQV